MCGFIGNFDKYQVHENASYLIKGGSYISSRGPDESPKYINNAISVYFHRLAIAGENNGTQPFINKKQDIIIVVNGEIYNHQKIKIHF